VPGTLKKSSWDHAKGPEEENHHLRGSTARKSKGEGGKRLKVPPARTGFVNQNSSPEYGRWKRKGGTPSLPKAPHFRGGKEVNAPPAVN